MGQKYVAAGACGRFQALLFTTSQWMYFDISWENSCWLPSQSAQEIAPFFFLYSASAVSLSFSPSSDFMRWGEIVTVLRAFKSEPGRHANILEVKRWGWKVALHKEDGENTQRDGRLHSQSSDQLVNISKLQSNEWSFFSSVCLDDILEIFLRQHRRWMEKRKSQNIYCIYLFKGKW